MIRYLVLAAGIGYRWHNYLGAPKHLLSLDGEMLLGRTTRLLREAGADDVLIVARSGSYRRFGQVFIPKTIEPTGVHVDKFLSSVDVWNRDGPTVWMWGDVWWSQEGIRRLVNDPHDQWKVWYRPAGSRFTGCDHGEMFAHGFPARDIDAELAACHRVVDLHGRGMVRWFNTGGWSQYRARLGLPDNEVDEWVDGRHSEIVDDWTDDFDGPGDYRRWYGRRMAGRYPFAYIGEPHRMMPRPRGEPLTHIKVPSDRWVEPDQLWCAVATAVETGRPVIPYTHEEPWTGEPWVGKALHTADRTKMMVVGDSRRGKPLRISGPLWREP